MPENDNITTLTDKELDSLAQTLQENESEDSKQFKDIANNNTDTEHQDIEEGIGYMSMSNSDTPIIDNDTKDNYKDSEDSITDIIDGSIDNKNNELFGSQVKSNANAQFDLSDEDAEQVLSIVLRIRSKEKFNIYNALPDKVKDIVSKLCVETGQPKSPAGLNNMAKFIMNEFINEANIDREFVDFQKSIEKEIQIPSLVDMYSEHICEVMEVKLPESAAKLRENGYTAQADSLIGISNAFKETYTFDKLKEFLASNRKARNHIGKDTKDYNKFCNDFNMRNKDTKFKINDIFTVGQVLNRVLPDEITTEQICNFIILFCKYCETNIDNKKTVDNAYMYYFIKNIIMLDYAEENRTEFSKQLVTNIIDMIKIIDIAEENYLKSMEERKQSKKNKK